MNEYYNTVKNTVTAWSRKLLSFLGAHRVQILIFCGALVVLFFRRPDALTNAQFWAEDAKWFADAVNGGFSIAPFFEPYAGYMTLIQRLIGWFAGLFPLEFSPLIFNLCALGIQALPVVYLWSKRTDYVPTRLKVLITAVYVLLPYTQEIHANVTNVQWFLAITLFLLLFIKESKNKVVRFIDRFFILVGSLSGPFSILLLPIVAVEAWRTKKILPRYYIVAFGALVQILCVLLTRETHGEVNIGYSFTMLFQIVGGQVFGSGLFGAEALAFFYSKPWIAPVVAVLGLQLLIYVFIKSGYVLRYFLIFAFMIFGASLMSTLGTPPGYSWWYYFTTEAFGGRYYFIPHLAVFVALSWLLLTQVKVSLLLRITAGVVLLLSFFIGIPRDFRHDPFKDFQYRAHIRQFKQLKPGESMAIPVNPGEGWHASLTR